MKTTTWNITSKQTGSATRESVSHAERAMYDAVIIGGGIAGVLAAYEATEIGKKVLVLEKEPVSESVTSLTTAFLTHVVDTSLPDLQSMFGDDVATKVWKSHAHAIDEIERIVGKEHIECDFKRVSGYAFASEEKQFQDVREEAEAAKELGFDITISRRNDLGFTQYGYYEVPRQGMFHPLKFVEGIKKVLSERGVPFIHAEATEITGKNPVVVKTTAGDFSGSHVLVATYDPFNHPKELLFHRGTYISYVMELQIPKGILKEGIYEDMNNPYYYFRVDAGDTHDRLIIGGEDHRHEIPMSSKRTFGQIERFAENILLKGAEYTVVRRWSGPILETIDGLAYIGSYSKEYPNRHVATGFSGNGMTYSTISALMFADALEEKDIRWRKVYDPKRVPTAKQLLFKGRDYVGELYNGAVKTIFGISKHQK
jgi:glycine/D-amino acid oxidase-like deaminating enzyme